jgi:hypothetical protein
VDKISKAIEAKPNSREEFKRLYDLLLCYRDVVRLAYDQKDHRLLEEQVAKIITPLLDQTKELIKKAKDDEIIDDAIVSSFDSLFTLFNFLINYSKFRQCYLTGKRQR